MRYARLPIEVESPEEFGYGNIRNNLAESSISDRKLSDLGLSIPDLTLLYTVRQDARIAGRSRSKRARYLRRRSASLVDLRCSRDAANNFRPAADRLPLLRHTVTV